MSPGPRLAELLPITAAALLLLSDAAQLLGQGLLRSLLLHASSFLLALGLAALAQRRAGWRFLGRALAVLLLGGWALEVVGTRTGLPFGEYRYTQLLQPQLAGVPVQVPVGWFTLGLLAFLLAGGRPTAGTLAGGIALMVAWDVMYEPYFVAVGAWSWNEGAYFGIPLTNFAGWALASFLFLLLLSLGLPGRKGGEEPPRAPLAAAYLAYAIDGALQEVILGAPLAGLIGLAAMCLALAGARRTAGRPSAPEPSAGPGPGPAAPRT